MIAVSSVFYRMYANIMRVLATDWSIQQEKVSDAQFGFYPDRSTMQPMFILHHLINQARFRKPGGSSRMYTAFMDFTQAYDCVDRQALWAHLQKIGMPAFMLRAIEGMYEGDTYTLVDGPKTADPVHPSRGVKQGCPLSPLLFSFFINDFTVSSSMGVPLHGQDTKVSHMFYADDLCLMSHRPTEVRAMLCALESYAKQKGLTINTAKSCVVAFNSRGEVREQFHYGTAVLDNVSEFKYLGMKFHRDGKMQHADRQWSRALWGAVGSLSKLAAEHGVQKRIDLVLKLYQVYAVPMGLYATHIWSTPFLCPDKVFASRVQSQHLSFLRHLVGARKGTGNWALLHELGQKPFQFYWWKMVIRFWNKNIEKPSSKLMVDVIRADVALAAAGCGGCWTGEVRNALQKLPVVDASSAGDAARGLMSMQPINWAGVCDSVVDSYNAVWRPFDGVESPRAEAVEHRKLLTYAKYFRKEDQAVPEIADYFVDSSLSHCDVVRTARFKLGSHFLGVEKGRFNKVPWPQRRCTRCCDEHLRSLSCPVDDEVHLVFDCEAFENLRVDEVLDALQGSNGSIQDFFANNSCSITSSFISSCMRVVDELEGQSEGPES
jgi:hypothetical protein